MVISLPTTNQNELRRINFENIPNGFSQNVCKIHKLGKSKLIEELRNQKMHTIRDWILTTVRLTSG